jgi:hypothetical protein
MAGSFYSPVDSTSVTAASLIDDKCGEQTDTALVLADQDSDRNDENHILDWIFLTFSVGMTAFGLFLVISNRRQHVAAGDVEVTEQRESERAPLPCTENIVGNFVFMSACLSLNHGCLIACFPLAIPSLGHMLGNVTLGMFYLSNTVAALLIATPAVQRLGAKKALVFSTFAFCTFVASLALSTYNSDTAVAAPIGAAIGGVAQAIAATAQGTYFSLTCRKYIELDAHKEERMTMEQATAKLSGVPYCNGAIQCTLQSTCV